MGPNRWHMPVKWLLATACSLLPEDERADHNARPGVHPINYAKVWVDDKKCAKASDTGVRVDSNRAVEDAKFWSAARINLAAHCNAGTIRQLISQAYLLINHGDCMLTKVLLPWILLINLFWYNYAVQARNPPLRHQKAVLDSRRFASIRLWSIRYQTEAGAWTHDHSRLAGDDPLTSKQATSQHHQELPPTLAIVLSAVRNTSEP